MSFCPHHPKLGLKFDGEKLACPHPDCDYRKDTPYKRIPPQEELLTKNARLIAENKRLWDKHYAIGDILNGEGTPAHKLAEIQQAWEAV